MTNATAHDLTRTAVLSGLSPRRWIRLLNLYMSKHNEGEAAIDAEDTCNALYALLAVFPSYDTVLQYLEAAIDEQTIPLPVFIATFPRAIMTSPQLQAAPRLWTPLLALALKPHNTYVTQPATAGTAPPQVLYDASKPPNVNVETIDNIIKLLASGIAPEEMGSLTTLLLLLLSAISAPGFPRLPVALSGSLINSVSELAQLFPIGDQRAAIENWAMTFSLTSGAMDLGYAFDDFLRPDTEQTIVGSVNGDQAAGEGANEVPHTEEDLVGPSVVIRSLLENRGTKSHGSANTTHAVALLLSTYRSTIVPRPAHPPPSNSPSNSGPQPRTSSAHLEATPGVTPGMTPAGGGSSNGLHMRTPASLGNSQSTIGRTPNNAGGLNAHTPANQANTPLAIAHTPAGRTPGNIPRTPGHTSRHIRTPTSIVKDNKRPGQLRAQVFYEKLFLSLTALTAEAAAKCRASSNLSPNDASTNISPELSLYRGLAFGKLPELLIAFQEVASACSSSSKTNQPSFRTAMETALINLFNGHMTLVNCCDPSYGARPLDDIQQGEGGATGSSPLHFDNIDIKSTYRYNLLSSLVRANLITADFAKTVLPNLLPEDDERKDGMAIDGALDSSPDIASFELGRLAIEAQESRKTLQEYCDERLLEAMTVEDLITLIEPGLEDYSSHRALSLAIAKTFEALVASMDLSRVNNLAKVVIERTTLVDILSLHVNIGEILAEGLIFLEDFDFEGVGDPQWTYTNVGSLMLLLKVLVYKFGLRGSVTSRNGRRLDISFIAAAANVRPLSYFSPEERLLMKKWHKYVFEPSSEGIGDKLLKSTHPKLLLKIAASLFSQALSRPNIDFPTLQSGGIAYFMVPLLNWSLVGVIRGLCDEALRKGYLGTLHLQVINTIVLDPNCPTAVIQTTGRSILRLMDEPTLKPILGGVGFDVEVVKSTVGWALNIVTEMSDAAPSPASQPQLARLLAQFYETTYSTTAPPTLTSLLLTQRQNLLHYVFSVLYPCVRNGEAPRACRQLALCLFVFPHPPTTRTPALLPYLLKIYLPLMLPWLDPRPAPDQALCINALVYIISWSLLTQFRTERALADIERVKNGGEAPSPDDMELDGGDRSRDATSYPSVQLAKSLSQMLKSANSTTGNMLHQKLLATPQFIANFPAFATA